MQSDTQTVGTLEGRDLDLLLAEHVFGLRPERIKPEWYGRDVTLFFHPDNPMAVYSYDDLACNARMYRNGVDESEGFVPSLPPWSDDLYDAWDVVVAMEKRGFFLLLTHGSTGDPDRTTASFVRYLDSGAPPEDEAETGTDGDPALAICRAAALAVAASRPSGGERGGDDAR